MRSRRGLMIDPFSDDNPFESSSKSQTQAKSAPPPRPEPPKTKQTFTQNVDPFSQVDPFQSNQDASNTPNQFANFANFDAFPS
ncbi:unnamed protein product [Anisakis simplex]|uniref:PI-PLC Y-box domain-containing protein n=1 Tax=Anisakis simplex TaxID=6269 RepID=A0A0M3JE25_ANISI|nr:unnamed protein product [Anisakis simplex]